MQSSGGTSGQPGTGQVLLPPNQAGAAQSYQDLFNPMSSLAMGAFNPDPWSPERQAIPGGWAYPRAQDNYNLAAGQSGNLLTGAIGQPTVWDDNVERALGGARMGSDYYANNIFPNMQNYPLQLGAAAQSGLPYLDQILSQAFDPRYSQAITDAQGMGAQMTQAGTDIMAQGFDPQSALFNRSQQQLTDQSAVANAMAGLGSSPYGAGVTSNALGNFDINWQNNQLARESQASQAAGNAFTLGSQLPLNALAARDQAAARGSSAYGSLLGSINSGMSGAEQLGMRLGQDSATMGALPYQTGAMIGNNTLNAQNSLGSMLTNTTNLGNNQYLLAQQMISDAMQYMGLGQSASQIAGSLQNQGFNQTAQGIGGLIGGANSLFGSNGLFGGSGGLFGSGAGSLSPLFGPTDAFGGAFAGGSMFDEAFMAAPFLL